MSGFDETTIPTAYSEGYERALQVDPELAKRYVAHTLIGDPKADAVLAALAAYPAQGQAWIQAGIEGGAKAIPAEAPEILRDFFAEMEAVPKWFDPAAARAGCNAFHRHSEMFLGAFVGAVLIEGFSTLISQSFSITGRLVDKGVQRLKQNNRHLVEIFLPGGLERHGEGWKLSVRIRLIHARVRQMLARSEDWDTAAWGVPLSAAHIGFSTAVFSAGLLKRAAMLGVDLSPEERRSFMMIWRYSGHLMGVEPALLFETEADALHLHHIGAMCEPPPGIESIILANGLINSAPIVAGITAPEERRKLSRRIFRISRAMIGTTLADQLHYPKMRVTGVLAALRWQNRSIRLLNRLIPALGRRHRAKQFQTMLSVSHYASSGISYRMPEHVRAENDAPL